MPPKPLFGVPDPTEEAPVFAPRLAAETEPCATCGALLAADQRYCLSCGERRAGTRVPFPVPAAPVVAAAPPPPPPRRRAPLPASALSALYGLAGAGALALGLLAGAVIVRAGDDPAPVFAAATPVATAVATAAAAVTIPTPAPTVAAPFTPDWPAGQNGWTIQLKTLPKDGTTPEAIATAKTEATGQGATDVGALDSDAFASLDGGNYVIYSGVSTSKKAAEDALGTLKANFPDASVVEVSDTAPAEKTVKKSAADLKKEEESQTPEEAQKNTRKAPSTMESAGPTQTPDKKKPGGDSDATEIG